jgi:hypothetical protein
MGFKVSSKTDGGLRGIIRTHLPWWQWNSIETGMTEQGVPDMEGAHKGHVIWIENKKSDAWAVQVEIAQIGWHLRRAAEGGKSFIAVRRMNTTKVGSVDELWLMRGDEIRNLNKHGLQGVGSRIVFDDFGPEKWDWKTIDKYLKS